MRLAVEAQQRGAVVKALIPELSRDIGVVHRAGRVTEAATAFLDYSKVLVKQWDRAIDRRIEQGESRIAATATTVAAMERRNVLAFRNESPIQRISDARRSPDL